MPALYEAVLEELTNEARQQEQVTGMLLTGSLARGDALPGTDIDIRYVITEGSNHRFEREMRDGVLVECGYSDVTTTRMNIDARPMNVYAYLDGQIRYDPNGSLAELRKHAQYVFDTYETPPQERSTIAALLGHTRDKTNVGMNNGDLLKAAFAAGTSSWGIMEGLWAANNKPLPPHSSVRPHLRDLSYEPDNIEDLYGRLFLAETPIRVQVALELIDWIIEQLSEEV